MRASVSRTRPRAHAICDRCGFRYNHNELQWQFQWAGTKLQNLRLLVCETCLDKPQEGLRTIVLPPDPVPISNPRPEISTAIYTSLREDGGVSLREESTLGPGSGNLDSVNFELEETPTGTVFQQ